MSANLGLFRLVPSRSLECCCDREVQETTKGIEIREKNTFINHKLILLIYKISQIREKALANMMQQNRDDLDLTWHLTSALERNVTSTILSINKIVDKIMILINLSEERFELLKDQLSLQYTYFQCYFFTIYNIKFIPPNNIDQDNLLSYVDTLLTEADTYLEANNLLENQQTIVNVLMSAKYALLLASQKA